ncbi:MAG: HAD-IIA family hydrolase, partial [Oscillospiraceae bacterium]
MNDLKDLLGARLFLLDMDGTLYLGDDVFPGAVDFIHTLAETGRQYIYLTNNSSRAGTDYITRLRRLGFPCEAENVFTSGMATALYLNQHYAGKPVYLVGTQAFRRELLSY